jgi:hypothetical protein
MVKRILEACFPAEMKAYALLEEGNKCLKLELVKQPFGSMASGSSFGQQHTHDLNNIITIFYDKAVHISPCLPYAWIARSKALISLGRLNEALKDAKEAYTRFPEHPGCKQMLLEAEHALCYAVHGPLDAAGSGRKLTYCCECLVLWPFCLFT